MDSARADILAAEGHLQTHGWVPRRSEAFRHLPPPELAQWLRQRTLADAEACTSCT